jgi:hypothetical protein
MLKMLSLVRDARHSAGLIHDLHDLPEWALVATTRPVGSSTEFIGWL